MSHWYTSKNMTTYIATYLDYLTYVPEKVVGASGAELYVRDIIPDIGTFFTFFLFFVGLNLLLPVAYRIVNKDAYYSFSPKYKSELSGYLTCIVHHSVIAPMGVFYLARDIGLYLDGGDLTVEQYGDVVRYSVMSVAYLCGDVIFSAIPEFWRQGKIDNLYHHVFTLALFWVILNQPLTIFRFMPHYFVCETSPLLYSVSWLLRRQGYENSVAKRGVELAFAGSFFVLRIINLNTVNVLVCRQYSAHLGVFGHALFWSMSLLQIFWFSKIVVIAMNGIGAKSKGE